jgi:large subunit ribosomal protein L10
MAVARLQKQENAKLLREEIGRAPHAILVDFKGLTVEQSTTLRRKLREGDARFRVVKNTTMLRAVDELPLAELKDVFVGQTALAYTEGDAVGLAKVLRDFNEEFETAGFKAGIVDGTPISAEDFAALAELPPRDELIAKALYLMNYPITGLVTALNGILSGFVIALDQIREQKAAAGDCEPVVEAAPAEEAPVEAAAEAAPEEAPAEEVAEAAPEEAPAEEIEEEK